MKRTLNLSAIAMTLTVLFSCNNDTQTEQKVAQEGCEDVHWSHHQGADGPENWNNLCSGFSDCGGTAQSPIDIKTSEAAQGDHLTTPEFRYGTTAVDITNNGHTVQFDVSGDHTVDLNGKEYTLLQFHYHAVSEHTIDGKHFPVEVHFVHKYSDSDFAVLGVMFEEGGEHELFSAYLDHFPKTKGEYKSTELIDLASLFPANKTYYHYSGSLTTPPCSEVVSWHVLATPVTASKEQIEQFSDILDGNYRAAQPLNGREVLIHTE